MRQFVQTALCAELLGARMDLVTADEVMAFVADAAEDGRKALVANHNLHSLHLVRHDAEMAALYEQADLVEVDSMPVILWGRLMGAGAGRDHRCTYLDWRDQFWKMAAARRWKVYYLGCAPGVAEAAAKRIMAEFPGVRIMTRHGYFDHSAGSADSAGVVAEINAFAPQVLMVGMGMPLQEVWIARNYAALKGGVVLPVGGAFDYEAGVQIAAPRILGELGLEWLFRLACQPRRLFRRYMIEPWSLIGPALKDAAARMGGEPVKAWERTLEPGAPAPGEAAAASARDAAPLAA